MRAPEFWAHEGLAARLLGPLGQAFGVVVGTRRRLIARQRAPIPVICVGNLTVGGAGKTPTTIAISSRLLDQGWRVHCLTRGHGGRERGPLRVDPERHDAGAVGDEALLLAEVAPTWIARDRLAGARAAATAGAQVVVMDDGLQHLRLRPDLALVVVDGAVGFGNRRLLPAGPLREPVGGGLARADAVVVIGADEAGLGEILPRDRLVLEAVLRPALGAPELAGRRVLAFAGIGRPAKFFRSLTDSGAVLVARETFADHHPYRRREIERLLDQAQREDALCITTCKDFIRIPSDLQNRVQVMPIELRWRDAAQLDRLLRMAFSSRAITI